MSFRALHIDDTLVAKAVALAALGLITLILFGLGQPAKAAAPSARTVTATSTTMPRCSGL